MSFIKDLFGKNPEGSDSQNIWKALDEENELDEIIKLSHQIPVVIFKHSTRCSISSMAKSRLERRWEFNQDEVVPYFLDLIQYRAISNRIEEVFDVPHQSPQLLLVKSGEAIFHTSHNDINAQSLKDYL